MHRTRNDLSSNSRDSLVGLLNARLVDALDLQMQAKQAHWNVKGPAFVGLHALFDDVAAHAQEHADEIAERAVALGGVALGTVQRVAKDSSLEPYPTDLAAGSDHAEALAERLAHFGRLVRTAIDDADELGDADTADLLTGVSRAVDKDLWMVEAHLQAKS